MESRTCEQRQSGHGQAAAVELQGLEWEWKEGQEEEEEGQSGVSMCRFHDILLDFAEDCAEVFQGCGEEREDMRHAEKLAVSACICRAKYSTETHF